MNTNQNATLILLYHMMKFFQLVLLLLKCYLIIHDDNVACLSLFDSCRNCAAIWNFNLIPIQFHQVVSIDFKRK